MSTRKKGLTSVAIEVRIVCDVIIQATQLFSEYTRISQKTTTYFASILMNPEESNFNWMFSMRWSMIWFYVWRILRLDFLSYQILRYFLSLFLNVHLKLQMKFLKINIFMKYILCETFNYKNSNIIKDGVLFTSSHWNF